MAQALTSVENNFTRGLITEFTGLNFPENAATDTDNCTYTLIGDVSRRLGINNETNYTTQALSRTGFAIASYKWNNVAGDGTTQLVVKQVGSVLYFYKSSSATTLLPLSTQILPGSVIISNFVSTTGTFNADSECHFTDGNGYLVVFHPDCDPFYVVYNAGVFTANRILVQIRDFTSIPEPSITVSTRPATLNSTHQYNLQNRGWIKGSPWQSVSTTSIAATAGVKAFTVTAGLTVGIGDTVQLVNVHPAAPGGVYQPAGSLIMSGNVTGYAGTTLNINITSINPIWAGSTYDDWSIYPTSNGYIDTFFTDTATYPANSDVWWSFKNASGVFNPATTVGNTTLNSGSAPQGHFLIEAFNQRRSLVSGISGLTDVTTPKRPSHGTWFQGRVWYTGVNAQQVATGDASYYTWTENIYFSQIIQTDDDFAKCYQKNDPSSETLFDLLPTDGGVIRIQGCGTIYKLFPIQNGMLVHAANGIWFITGSQGIGFSATDYTITKLSSIQSISTTSFVNVNGLPYFWNEEGIYTVTPSKSGGLEVNPITIGTILSFYESIPVSSKKYVRGDYHPIDYVIQWVYRSTEATTVTDRYTYDSILNFNTYNKAFYPYSVDTSVNSICGIQYVSYPGGSTAPLPSFKYLASNTITMSFADEHDTAYVDWGSINYDSYFVTGYKLHGDAQRRFQIPYLYIFSRADAPTSYKIQGLWDYASTGNSGRWSVAQLVNNWSPNFGMIFRRHRIRGRGIVLQIKVSSLDGQPFDIMGWSSFETQNTGI